MQIVVIGWWGRKGLSQLYGQYCLKLIIDAVECDTLVVKASTDET